MLSIHWRAGLAVGLVCVLFTPRLAAQDARAPAPVEGPVESGPEGRGRSAAGEPGRKDQGGESSERPGPFDPIFERVNPARLQREFDKRLGLDSGDRSDRPRPPEIPEAVFFDVVRPLGDLKYANEINYLFNSSSRNAPTLQVIEYEYVFADWRAAELDLSYFNGNLEILTPFYQRTLGVGPRRNWVHGYQLSLELYLRSGFVGGSPVYNFAWKPEEDSRFSTSFFVGANRALIGGFRAPGAGLPFSPAAVGGASDRTFGAWRPTFNADVFYKLSDRWTVGVENDLFFHTGKAGEYLSFPFVTCEMGKHAFIQVGAGYYRFESRDQLTFLAHVNLVNPSKRRAGESEPTPSREPRPEGPRGEGRLRGWLSRMLGDR